MIPILPAALATGTFLIAFFVQTWHVAWVQNQRAALCAAAGLPDRPSQDKCLEAIEALAEDSRRLVRAEAEAKLAQEAGKAISRQVQAALSARAIETRTIEREIINAPASVACASSPAVGIALDVLRERAGREADAGVAPSGGATDAVPASPLAAGSGF